MHTFKSLLETQAIEIPMIQRDYAQGRTDSHATRVRQEIVEQLRQATLEQKELDFDFIYGTVRNNTLRPLDGQQRLTTLFLLYWYIGRYRRQALPAYLHGFTYETRISARDFFHAIRTEKIIEIPKRSLSMVIQQQKWFHEAWLHDPTIQGALTMMDQLDDAFKDVSVSDLPDLENEEPNITFHYLDLDEFRLDESLYIKMNSRGKPLTSFEHFKAQFEQMLERQGWMNEQQEFSTKIEVDWSDLIWPHRDSKTQTIDATFLNVFRFVSSILALRLDVDQFEDQEDLFNNVTMPEVFSDIYREPESVRFLFDVLNTWSTADEMAHDFSIYLKEIPLLHQELLERFLTGTLSNEDQFAVYAILVIKQNSSSQDTQLVRVIRNLIEGIRQNNQGVYNSNLRFEMFSSLYKQIEQLIIGEGTIIERLEKLQSPFNDQIVKHEIEKQNWINENIEKKSLLYRLEDHPVLKGLTHRIFPIFTKHGEVAVDVFYDLLQAPPSLVSRAMLSIEDYSLVIGRSNLGPRYVFGGTKYQGFVWTNQLSKNKVDEDEKQVQFVIDTLIERLIHMDGPMNESLKQIIHHWSGERDWRYYMTQYELVMTDKGHVFTFTGENALQIERLNGVNLQGSHANPIYIEVAARNPVVIVEEVYYDYLSEMNVNGIVLHLVDKTWKVEGDVDEDFIQNLISTDEDVVMQGVRLTRWLAGQSAATKVK
ncbi:DUF262 domain-containing protein [Exiguobacterium sp. B2(2022)]|uniref:DUF262 domain-containing protein n=1 Tax=Exiguobacterium sp. B2(2022) TaxID=2992755 RepID=UPI00237BD762|nr:DUF262 domain-containing protein [Exiguobacterium sp. B2(2022)]MDE0564238.1 DUF262 domain-containing protein [Exiguobacterium sp. B2(2022)]